MSAERGSDHWFDRLAVAHTRRHTFKTALAATALAVPFMRSPRRAQAAEDSHACFKGCIYASQREFKNADTACNTRPIYGPLFETVFFGTGFLGLSKLVENAATEIRCWDRALLEKQDRDLSCTGPGCPGFDPAGTWGPCRNCATINGCQCCPDSSAPTGYTYCSSLSNYCCSPNGGCKVCGT